MKFLADLHIHSKYSIATSKNLDLAHIHQAAQIKGISVVGTGDCTHPGWLAELESQLEPAEAGLYQLKRELAVDVDNSVPQGCRRPVRFMLQGEISCIYKKDGRTRKNHNLVYLPHLESARKFSDSLAKIGNIASDGRPILGLDARDLLEIVLETSPDAFLIPAHIWTPWFSMLGSKSGFDALDECFGDLSDHIFAVETGLSSDPEMNWRVSALDGLRLVSNSDAHSPKKLGREVNRLEAELSYAAIREALATKDSPAFKGTVEFYPEEGKYHLDGNRKCEVRWEPRRTLAAGGICPVCAKPLTLGVLHRVELLADRDPGYRSGYERPFDRIVPLTDILAEIFQVGAQSKKVQGYYERALARLGSEMDILLNLPPDEIESAGIGLLAEAVRRMRRNQVEIAPGYDGEFGKVRFFSARERRQLVGQRTLFTGGASAGKNQKKIPPPPVQRELNIGNTKHQLEYPSSVMPDLIRPPVETLYSGVRRNDEREVFNSRSDTGQRKSTVSPEKKFNEALGNSEKGRSETEFKLNSAQQAAVDHVQGPLIIVAGPGTGKTRTLTQRMAALLTRRHVPAAQMLAVTFTNKAAGEMHERLRRQVGASADLPWIGTFHGLGRYLLQDSEFNLGHGAWADWILADEALQHQLVAEARRQVRSEGVAGLPPAAKALEGIMTAKQQLKGPRHCPPLFNDADRQQGFVRLYQRYEDLLAWQQLLDFEDLIAKVLEALASDADALGRLRSRFRYLFIDEYQDINYGQYRLVRKLFPEKSNICVIGDPNQSIYGFRGSDRAYFERFSQDYPGAGEVHLIRNYRSTPAILAAAAQILPVPAGDGNNTITADDGRAGDRAGSKANPANLQSDISGAKTIGLLESATPRAEAVAVGKTIEALVGGMDLHAIDQHRIASRPRGDAFQADLSFADFAVLYRTSEQARVFCEVFDGAGIPRRVAGRKQILDLPALVCLVALLKLMENQGGLWDIIHSASLLTPRLSPSTLDILKIWSFERRLNFRETLNNALRFPIPAMGRRRQRELHHWIESLHHLQEDISPYPLVKKLKHLGRHLGLQSEIDRDESAREGYRQLIQWAGEADNQASWFFAGLALNQDPDLLSRPAEKVTLLTMHAAKGLEFPVVFVVGCEDGLVPLRRENPEEWDEGEERRLLYVAMTRARQRLYLSWSRQRTRYGQKLKSRISPLITAIDPELMQSAATGRRRPAKHRQLQLF